MITTKERSFVPTAETRTELTRAFDKAAKAFEGVFEAAGVMSPDDIPAFFEEAANEHYLEHLARRKAYKAKKEAENARNVG